MGQGTHAQTSHSSPTSETDEKRDIQWNMSVTKVERWTQVQGSLAST